MKPNQNGLKVIIETIPHDKQRYPTVGDWKWDEDGTLHILISELSDWRRVALIAVHELVEVLLCKHAGITQEQVDKFDMDFETNREAGNEDEPGDDPDAPYVAEHCFATGVERLLCAGLGVDWKEYEEELSALP